MDLRARRSIKVLRTLGEECFRELAKLRYLGNSDEDDLGIMRK